MIKNLNKNLLGAALLSAVALSAAPAPAATLMGCGGDHMMKVNDYVSALPDGAPNKWVANKELALASTALSESKPGECAMHLSRAEHAGMMH